MKTKELKIDHQTIDTIWTAYCRYTDLSMRTTDLVIKAKGIEVINKAIKLGNSFDEKRKKLYDAYTILINLQVNEI